MKISLNKISFPLIPPNFGGNENWGLEGIRKNECFILFLSLKLSNKEMIFPFIFIPSYLNFQIEERKEYS